MAINTAECGHVDRPPNGEIDSELYLIFASSFVSTIQRTHTCELTNEWTNKPISEAVIIGNNGIKLLRTEINLLIASLSLFLYPLSSYVSVSGWIRLLSAACDFPHGNIWVADQCLRLCRRSCMNAWIMYGHGCVVFVNRMKLSESVKWN